jgi:hypothetical protein
MFTGKVLRAALDKFMKGEVAANARVQVILPNGEFYDITGVKLLEKFGGYKIFSINKFTKASTMQLFVREKILI